MPQYLYCTKSLQGMTFSFHNIQNKTLLALYYYPPPPMNKVCCMLNLKLLLMKLSC